MNRKIVILVLIMIILIYGCVQQETSKDNSPSTIQKKMTIHCKPTVLPPRQRDVQSPLVLALSLVTPCPTDDGAIKARTTVSLVSNVGESGLKAIKVTLTPKGNINLVGANTYNINNIVSSQPTIRDVELQIVGPGMGSLNAQAQGVGNDEYGSADIIFFLLAKDGDFIVSQSSFFELERAKLTSDLQSGIINKTKYDQEVNKMLEGKHTYVCSQIPCY